MPRKLSALVFNQSHKLCFLFIVLHQHYSLYHMSHQQPFYVHHVTPPLLCSELYAEPAAGHTNIYFMYVPHGTPLAGLWIPCRTRSKSHEQKFCVPYVTSCQTSSMQLHKQNHTNSPLPYHMLHIISCFVYPMSH